MKSGLEGRNNTARYGLPALAELGLNEVRPRRPEQSGRPHRYGARPISGCLNEVRPRRPEQCDIRIYRAQRQRSLNEVRPRRPEQSARTVDARDLEELTVSMKSGLEGRNNLGAVGRSLCVGDRLNEVRPRRPEQSGDHGTAHHGRPRRLNEVRPRRPEQWRRWGCPLTGGFRLNEVRPRRPEQWGVHEDPGARRHRVSMKSGLEGRNNV